MTPARPDTRPENIFACARLRRLTTGCRRRWAGWEVVCRRDGRSPTAPGALASNT